MNAETLEIVLKIAGLIFAVGVIYGELKAIRKDISRLEKKVEQHNTFDRRIIALETAIEIYHAQERAKELQK